MTPLIAQVNVNKYKEAALKHYYRKFNCSAYYITCNNFAATSCCYCGELRVVSTGMPADANHLFMNSSYLQETAYYRKKVFLCSSYVFYIVFSAIPWTTPWDPHKVTLVMQGKVMTLQKLNCWTCSINWGLQLGGSLSQDK